MPGKRLRKARKRKADKAAFGSQDLNLNLLSSTGKVRKRKADKAAWVRGRKMRLQEKKQAYALVKLKKIFRGKGNRPFFPLFFLCWRQF